MYVNDENTEVVVQWVLPDGSTVQVTHLARDGVSILQSNDMNHQTDSYDLSDNSAPTVAEKAPG